MNGEHAALVELAQRSQRAARECADALVESKHAWERVEMRQDEQGRDIKAIRSELAVLRTREPARRQLQSFTEDEWTESDTGHHYEHRMKKTEFERLSREREMTADARKWRKVLRVAGKIALALALVVGGWLVRHLMGHP